MQLRIPLAALLLAGNLAAANWVLIRTVDGESVEGQTNLRTLKLSGAGAPATLPIEKVLSVHSAAPASEFEAGRITAGLAAIQSTDRKARDQAVEELTAIGLPVLTPLLETLKDTDQHEPRPLYRLFERLIPGYADGFDRTLALIRVPGPDALRAQLPAGSVDVRTASGEAMSLPWAKIRSLAVRQNRTRRTFQVHSLKHSTQIEYLDSGVVLAPSSKLDSTARGFVRLSWQTDSWASDPNGLTKPGSPAYKSHLFDGHPFGALVGRAGAAGEVFFLGAKQSKSGLSGRLRLAVNDNRHWQNNLGAFLVTLTVTDAYDLGDPQ
ncbi:MAG: hypothetical protein R2762_27895 [Bryobacteraceae bacterium]